MQLSAANLIIASQQIARAQQQPAPDTAAKFTAALKAGDAESTDFAPMEFKQAAPAAKAENPVTAAPSGQAYGQASPLGGQIDIRV